MFSFYSRILVAYDGSDLSKRALEHAVQLAKQDERIEIHVVKVMELPRVFDYELRLSYEQIQKSYRKEVEKKMDEVKKVLSQVTNRSKTIILEGDPARMILEYARSNDVDFIVMGSRGLSGLKELFLGSVSHNVMQHASCPVLVIK